MDAELDERVQELARKAVAKSGNKFFHTLLKNTRELIQSLVDRDLDDLGKMTAQDVEDTLETLTADNMILVSRWYAGDITKLNKKRKRGVQSNAEKINVLFDNNIVAMMLKVVFLATYMEEAQEECERRAAKAEASEHWTRDYIECDPAEEWSQRAEAIQDAIDSWQAVAEAIKAHNWDDAVDQLSDMAEIDA